MPSPYLEASTIRELRPNDVSPSDPDAALELLISEFVEISEGYRGCRFADVGQDPDVYPGVPHATPPATWVRACTEYVISVLRATASGQSRDVIAQTFDGGMTRYSTPDVAAGRPSGFLEVDRLLNSLPDYRLPGVA